MTTFLTLQTEVQYQLRQRTDLLTFVKSKLNSALLDVMLLVKPPEFQSTTAITTSAGTAAYDLGGQAEDVLAVLGVSIDAASISREQRRLGRGTFEEYDEMDTSKTGVPQKWFRYANDLVLYNKVPDNNDGSNYALTVRILERPTVMSANADVFPLQSEWEEPVVLRAISKMFTLMGDAGRKQLADSLFQESVGFVVDAVKNIENRHDHDAGMRQGTHRTRGTGRHGRR